MFNLPGQFVDSGPDVGKARIANTVAFRLFCLMNATSLFISLAVVVVQITLVAWDTSAQKLVVSVINKLMWAAGLSTCGAFLSIAFVVVGKRSSWMAITITVIGAPILMGTLASLCYLSSGNTSGLAATPRDASEGPAVANLFPGPILPIFRF